MGKWNGGMGPQTIINKIEIDKEAIKERNNLLNEFRGGQEFGCPKCGEPYKIGSDAEVEDIRELQHWLANDNCPYCKEGSMAYYKRLHNNNMIFANVPHTFKIITDEYEVEYYCIRLGRR